MRGGTGSSWSRGGSRHGGRNLSGGAAARMEATPSQVQGCELGPQQNLGCVTVKIYQMASKQQ